MPYDESFANRVQQSLQDKGVSFEAKKLMGGLCYTVDDKMCLGVSKDKQSGEDYLIARVGEAVQIENVNQGGCHHFAPAGRIMKDFLRIEGWAVANEQSLGLWIDRCLAFNPLAKSSKK